MAEEQSAEEQTWGTPAGQAMIELLWTRGSESTKGPKQRLSVDQIVNAAVELADRDGIDAISMRKVAAALSVGTMSLYTYVPGRDELFELMIDEAFGERELPDGQLDWRKQLEFHAEQAWQMYQRHPWLIWSNLWRMPLGPHVLDVEEDLYRIVRQLDFSAADATRIANLIESHVFAAARGSIVETRQSANTGVSSDDYWESRAGFWGTFFTEERFPNMTALWTEGGFDGDDSANGAYTFGLSVLLDGIEARLRG